MAKANFILTLFGEMSRKNIGQKRGKDEKTEKIITEKKENRKEKAEALEKRSLQDEKNLDHNNRI